MAVVGAGIVGASVAFHASQLGAHVAIFERSEVASGATGASSAILRVHTSNLALAQLAAESQAEWFAFERLVGGTAGVRRFPFVRLFHEANHEAVQQTVTAIRELGIETYLADAREVRRDFALAVADDELAAVEPECGYADGHMAATAYVGSVEEVHLRCAATGIAPRSGGGWWLDTDMGRDAWDAVVLACGPDLREINGPEPYDVPSVQRKPIFYGVVDPGPGAARPNVIVMDGPNAWYCRPEGPDHLLISPEIGTRLTADGGLDVESLRHAAVEGLVRRVPGLAGSTWLADGLGADGYTADHVPVVAALEEGLYCAVGMSGTGFKTAPALGRRLADDVVNRRPPSGPLADLGVGRRAAALYATDHWL